MTNYKLHVINKQLALSATHGRTLSFLKRAFFGNDSINYHIFMIKNERVIDCFLNITHNRQSKNKNTFRIIIRKEQ